MTNKHINTAVNLLSLVRLETDSIGIAVSFGKDSLTTIDLCYEIFDRLEEYYLYRVRDLSIVNEWNRFVKKRYNLIVRMYPHFDLSRCYRNAVLQPHWKDLARNTPQISMADIEFVFRKEKNIDWIAYGWRRNDSFSRALIMKQTNGFDEKSKRVFPLRTFTRKKVYEYLAKRKIPIPNNLGRKEQAGLDFHPKAIRFLKENNYEDYLKWIKDFPFSEIQLVDNEE